MEDDNRYEGEWKKGKKEGKGIPYLKNGDKYKDEFKNDKLKGTWIYFKNGDSHKGDWINDKREGKGILYWINGDSYDSDFKNNKRDGKGIIYLDNPDLNIFDSIKF